MKRYFTILASFLCVTFCTHSFASESMDKIVAIVNDDVITHSELNQAVSTALIQLRQQATQPPKQAELQDSVLEQLINKKLQLQAAEHSGIKVTETDLDNAIAGIAKENQITVEDLYQRLGQEGMNITDYRREIKEQLTMQKLQQQEIVSHIAVSPQEIDSYLHSKAWENKRDKQYHIEDIIVPLSETPSEEDIKNAQTAAKLAQNELKKGKSLNSTTKNIKDYKLRGTDFGWRSAEQIPTAFVDQITHMRDKDVSSPIRTGNGYHVLRLLSTKAQHAAAPNRKQVEQYLLRHKFEEAIQDWVSKLRNQAFITKPSSKNANKYV